MVIHENASIRNMYSPAISVVIPLYNKEKEILRSLCSVLAQTYQDYEIIVVNDGSTDKGIEIVHSIKDPRIRIIDQLNAGVSAARNRGIAEATAELIAFLDADDEWLPDYLETILLLQRSFPDCDIFGTRYFIKRSERDCRMAIIKGLPSNFMAGVLPDYFMIATRSEPPLWTSAVAVTKKAINSVRGFPLGISTGEDLLTWARLAISYKIAYFIEPKAIFWEALSVHSRGRRPQYPDHVGEALISLAKASPQGQLYAYASLWHQMRANIYIQLADVKGARRESQIAMTYNRRNFKNLFMCCLTSLPSWLALKVFHLIKWLSRIKRRQQPLCIDRSIRVQNG